MGSHVLQFQFIKNRCLKSSSSNFVNDLLRVVVNITDVVINYLAKRLQRMVFPLFFSLFFNFILT